ncbi:MAG TPA: translation factor GTPase family protein [Streptosporangiaceae bacterium]|nr:translation factor GTPase family protein [Streptosporangiaceae bacterium]
MATLNLGILAHVDAGKTSLTERLLCDAGVIGEIGRVDDGSTQTDTLALERQRGITIKSAVVSFAIDGLTVNLIDTPGHPDFVAEVERVLSVLDGAILVISAVEGVQAQTGVLMRTLQRLRIPTVIFVNKIDRRGARPQAVLSAISDRLTRAIVAMGKVTGPGSRAAGFAPSDGGDAAFAARLAELLAEHDDALLAAYVQDEAPLPYRRLRAELAVQVRQALVHPVFFGSAATGAGTDCLAAALAEFLPSASGEQDGPPSGTVFKVERGRAGEKIGYVRMFSGTLRARERLALGHGRTGKVTSISVFEPGSPSQRAEVTAGQIAKVRGLSDIAIGDTLGVPRPGRAGQQFAPPTLEAIVVPRHRADRGRLRTALVQLAEQDPLINLREDSIRPEPLVSLYGEVQKEVIQATLADDFGIEVSFRATTTIRIERPAGTGAAAEFMDTEPNPFRATVGLRIEPALAGSGIRFALEIELGALPSAFVKAVEVAVTDTLRQGIYGWQVTDCTVSMTHSGYVPPPPFGWSKWSSSAGDFRALTPLVVMTALARAGTAVFEPMHHFRVEAPADTIAAILPALGRLRAIAYAPALRGALAILEGRLPAAEVQRMRQQLPGLTRGEGVLESAFECYEPVRGTIPTRPRSDHNPLNRREYLLRIARRT